MRLLGENYSIYDEEDSRILTVGRLWIFQVRKGLVVKGWHQIYLFWLLNYLAIVGNLNLKCFFLLGSLEQFQLDLEDYAPRSVYSGCA